MLLTSDHAHTKAKSIMSGIGSKMRVVFMGLFICAMFSVRPVIVLDAL